MWTHIYLSGVRLSVDLYKNGHQKDICFKEIGLPASNMFTNSRFNSQHNLGEHKNLHFDNE